MAGFRMHFIVSAPDGPIASDGGAHSPEVATLLGPYVGRPGNYAIACDPTIELSAENRATDRPYLVACPRCKATPIFKQLWVPHPQMVKANSDTAETADDQIAPVHGPTDAKPAVP